MSAMNHARPTILSRVRSGGQAMVQRQNKKKKNPGWDSILQEKKAPELVLVAGAGGKSRGNLLLE